MEKKSGLWGRRIVAFIIDFLIITLIIWVIFAILYLPIAFSGAYFTLNFSIIVAGILILLYFTYLEGRYGATIGKSLMKLKVEPLKGQMHSRQILIRNLSKFLYLPLILDLIVGFAVGAGDRYLDKLTQTTVVFTDSEIIDLKKEL
jgi:uncharacterized RDD family membrane protein YckC